MRPLQILKEGLFGFIAVGLITAAGAGGYNHLVTKLRENPRALPSAPPPPAAKQADCKIAKVSLHATSFGKRPTGKQIPPALVWVSYLNQRGQPVSSSPECPKRWGFPVWTITGDERGVLQVSQWPMSGDLFGPPGSSYTLHALEPMSGLIGSVEVEFAGDASGGKEKGPRVVPR